VTDYGKICMKLAVEGDANIIQFMLHILAEERDIINFTKMLNICLVVCERRFSPPTNREALYEKDFGLRGFVERKRITKKKRYVTLFLPCINRGNVWERSAESGKPEELREIWKWAEENLTREEIYNRLLFDTDNKGANVWHLAAEGGNQSLLEEIWEWVKKDLTTKEISNKLLLATDNMSRTVRHVAAEGKNLACCR
jgi:hypothetical protein